MSVLVFVEGSDGKVKNTSLEAICYGAALEIGEVTAIAFGDYSEGELSSLGKYGANKVLHVSDERLKQGTIEGYVNALAQAFDELDPDILVLAKSSLGEPVSARVSVRVNASLASNVVSLPDTSNGFVVKRSVYTGKAFSEVELISEKKIISIKKNVLPVTENQGTAKVEDFSPSLSDKDFRVKITSQEKAEGDVLLPEADIVVSGGRGMKGPENWGILEDLAKVLGAATACSKPVSDMEWRPHHEHVGQTGIKVAPSLYIAIGISGAIQHLAGVNASKVIVVINNDPEAPFFSTADYGIVGDAFEVVPKLTEAVKALNN